MQSRLPLVLALLVAVLCAASFTFAADVGDSRPEPVAFEDTIELGLTGAEATQAQTANVTVPRAQVFYSQYRFVAGYQTIGALVTERRQPGHERQFGRPLVTYVTDFAGDSPTLTDAGYIRQSDSQTEWVPASEAVFVVGSRARTPAGPAVLPFSSESAAVAFAGEYGGTVTDWSAVTQREFDTTETTREQLRERGPEHRRWANSTVSTARELLDRPVSVTVGQDAPTLSAAIAKAPANTTVRVPAGTYEGPVTVQKPITIRGAGDETLLRGNGTGTVLSVEAERVAVTDLQLRGIGETIVPDSVPTNESGTYVQLNYAYADAGIVFDEANDSYVSDVGIETPSNGLIARHSDGLVVENLSVRGTETPADGSMGVLTVDSRVVVQRSTFVGGRDGVYMHLGDGTVVRNNRMRQLRYGVHLMYTDGVLVEENTVRSARTGVIVMTGPAENVIVDNVVRESLSGLRVSGASTYVAENVLVDNDRGLSVLSKRSLYEHNTIVDNGIGLVSSALLPTNTVVENDIVDNRKPAQAGLGPLRLWNNNYWGSAPGIDQNGDGVLDRSYHATGTVDAKAGTAPGADILAQSPALRAQRTTRSTLPSLSETGITDLRPRASPVRPAVLVNHQQSGNATRADA